MVSDIIKFQNGMREHQHSFTLWPQQWATYPNSHDWQRAKLDDAERGNVPDTPGIYTLLTLPGTAGHPCCSYLMYVGKANSLRRRFGDYLGKERRESGRPKVFRFLNQYSAHIWFCFTQVEKGDLRDVEDGLLVAYLPPLNDQFPAEFNKVVRGAF